MKFVKPNSKNQLAFSLVELLTTVAVIGILAAIALPNMMNVTDSGNAAKARRNAQNIAFVYNSARSAGVGVADLGVNGSITHGTPEAVYYITNALSGGRDVRGQGLFSGTIFGISKLALADLNAANDYLAWDDINKSLTYNASTDVTEGSGGTALANYANFTQVASGGN